MYQVIKCSQSYLYKLEFYFKVFFFPVNILKVPLFFLTYSSARPIEKNKYQKVAPWLTMILALVQIIKEIFQMVYLRLHFFKDPVNYLEFTLYSSTFVFTILCIIQRADDFFEKGYWIQSKFHEYIQLEDIKWQAGSVSILLAWANLLLYLKGFPAVGLPVVMFVEVLKTFIKVISVFGVCLIAFALSFYALLSEQDAFQSVSYSIFKTAVMTIGEFQFDDIFISNIDNASIFPYKTLTFIIFSLFLITMPIVLMNLLVGK